MTGDAPSHDQHSAASRRSLRDLAAAPPPVLDAALPPSEARARLASAQFGLVVDGTGAVLGLVTPDGLSDAPRRATALTALGVPLLPAVLVPADTELAVLAAHPDAITLLDLLDDDPLLVVVEDIGTETPLGVLPVELIDRYLATQYRPPSPTLGEQGPTRDVGLPWPSRLPLARVVCQAPDCGEVNELRRFERTRPPYCLRQPPRHALELPRPGQR
ncbi:hypothetical protein SAMN06272735_0008 [Streptomyces sp. TLI_55]|uniref:hypothetical protein n=1 Tax=Streptomyces TaxID=1883 RepID=UPI000BCA05C0|nr:hypothetical protein [Streptomyces sp. TLI_55]SNX88806.1 hypothetical protein SAMN06272735_0008 [Streptomyces sp. TLI_55]